MSESEKNEVPMSEPTSTPSTPSAAEKPKKIRDKVVKFMCAVLLALIFLLAGLIGGWLIGVNSLDDRARSLVWLLERVEANYYREIDDEELYDRLYAALELDKFCTYYNEDEYDSLIRESQGNNSGLGISVIYEGDAVRLYRTVYNSPAERAGLEGGMYLYRYGQDAEHLAEVNSGTFMNGVAALSTVTLEAGFEGGERKLYTVTRESYSAAYCEYRDSESSFRFRGKGETVLAETEQGGMSSLDATTAYIRFTEFDGNAAREFRLCLEKMKERGRTNLVLDLRCNGGGYLVTLCQIAAHLLKNAEGRSPLVATARYRNGRVDRYTAAGNDFGEYFTDTSRIRVLADENTASASEALMGAMLDYGTITLDDIYLRVSETDGTPVARTYGKGVMQSTFEAPNGRALRLTVAEIFWPKGSSIHDVGIRTQGKNAVNADLFASGETFLSLI